MVATENSERRGHRLSDTAQRMHFPIATESVREPMTVVSADRAPNQWRAVDALDPDTRSWCARVSARVVMGLGQGTAGVF